ncbi:hypothetical protein GBAR_LOCUS17033, partial [Geodia barretti]
METGSLDLCKLQCGVTKDQYKEQCMVWSKSNCSLKKQTLLAMCNGYFCHCGCGTNIMSNVSYKYRFSLTLMP